jgi:hypothetical protein
LGRILNKYFLVLLVKLLISQALLSQASNFGCETGAVGSSEYVPTFNVNLSSSPTNSASQAIVIPSSGFGECCGQANNVNCFVLAITLNPNAQGIQFNLSGASGNADIWYSNCSIGPFNIGYTFCVSGAGPHYFTFCRTGSTDYGVVVQSIAAPSNSGNIVTQNGCIDNFIVYGLQKHSSLFSIQDLILSILKC